MLTRTFPAGTERVVLPCFECSWTPFRAGQDPVFKPVTHTVELKGRTTKVTLHGETLIFRKAASKG